MSIIDPEDFAHPDSDVREAAGSWDVRRAYIKALGNLRDACSREMDRAQVGIEPGSDIIRAIDLMNDHRVEMFKEGGFLPDDSSLPPCRYDACSKAMGHVGLHNNIKENHV